LNYNRVGTGRSLAPITLSVKTMVELLICFEPRERSRAWPGG
jgi:hypothetical protein